MKTKIVSFFALFFFVFSFNLSAIEGMWLPYLLQKINSSEMQAMGLRITLEEIYSINQPSLKDAIVQFGNGCTGEIVSDQGLLLTNHHCGYRNIQQHSSVNHDYLTNGFWAPDFRDELVNPGLTASILQNMEDVTIQVLKGVDDKMSEKERNLIIEKNISDLIGASDEPFIKREIKAFYYGNQYILMTSLVFKDVRLVGAPPSNIGKFGGDTDNWMWPRHTGDFSVFRIYANENNDPADYAPNNRPYKPAKSLQISLKGYDKGDFTFVFGYPGTTQQYLSAAAVKLITQTTNPFKIDIRRQQLDVMSSFMEKNPKTRIQYSAKYAGVANGWKKWIGENKGITRLNTVVMKTQQEADFIRWAKAQNNEFQGLIPEFNALYSQLAPWELSLHYFLEIAYYYDFMRYLSQFHALENLNNDSEANSHVFNQTINGLKASVQKSYRDYDFKVERELMIIVLDAYKKFPYQNIPMPDVINSINKNFKGNTAKYVDYIFSKSIFTDSSEVNKLLSSYKVSDFKKLKKDPLFKLSYSIYSNFYANIRPQMLVYQNKVDSLQRLYMKAQLQKEKGQYLFPDANSTLRISYGKVDSYEPRDGVIYNHFTTLDGILEKENPEIYDYVVEPKLKTLNQTKNFGRYMANDQTMHTCFIGSNHTTGGNSGSPVLNADGHLIGINFDRNWEGTMSDLDYDPDQCRNIMIDIRYCLFIIEHFANANRLIEEMSFVE